MCVCLEESGTELQVEAVRLRAPTAGFVPSLFAVEDVSPDNRTDNNFIVWVFAVRMSLAAVPCRIF